MKGRPKLDIQVLISVEMLILSQKNCQKWIKLVLAFLPHVMRSDTESTLKNSSIPVLKVPNYSNVRISEISLASDSVI